LGYKLKEILKTDRVAITFLYEYLTPLKNNDEQKLLNVNWIYYVDNPHEVENFVLNSFWQRNKNCPISVDVEIHNTVKSIRKMLQIRRNDL